MIRICDYIFNKDEVKYIKKVDYVIADSYRIRVVFKNLDDIELYFNNVNERDMVFAEIIKEG